MKSPQKITRIGLLAAVCAFALATATHAQVRTGQGGAGGLGGAGQQTYTPPGMVGEAIISADPETRRIIVITDEETSEHVNQVITSLDRPKPQVLIKVVFLELTYRKGSDIGLEGQFTKDLGNGETLSLENAFGLAAQGANPVPPGAGLYQILGDDFRVTLRAISEAGTTEVLSRPSILARNNQQAVIIVGQELPFITNTRITETGQTINTVQYQDIGIILRVTPFITSDGMVEMIVAPEISTLTDQTVPISTGVSAPVIAKRAADTVVVTPDRQTVVIGGLMENNKTQRESKIPLLGDIPLLGNLFKRKVKDNTKTELIIFLTPYIVHDPSQLGGLTREERGKIRMAPNAFTEEELNRFLDGLPESEREGAAQPAQ